MIKLMMKREGIHFKVTILILFFYAISGLCVAQQPDLEFTSINALANLANNKSKVFAQDSIGYLWIGTEQGLYRFDGKTSYSYARDENHKNNLPESRVNKLLYDSKSRLWICTNEGLFKYNPELNNFSPVISDTLLRGAPGYIIEEIAEDIEGQIYIAYEKSIYKFDQQNNSFSKVVELNQGKIESILFDSENNIWIASSLNGGLAFYNQKEKQITSFLNNPRDKQSISNNEVLDIALVKGNLWIATYGGGIDSYNLKSKTFKHYFSPYYFENFVRNIYADRNKNIWICTLGSLKLFNPSTDSFYNYYYDSNKPGSISKGITGFYEDCQGDYWAVHTVDGVRMVKHRNKFKKFDSFPENQWHLSEKNITAMTEDGSGHFWFGNYYNGIDVFKFDEGRTDRYVYKPKNLKSLGNGSIFSIFCDSKKRLWIGTNMNGLQRFIPDTKEFESYLNKPEDTLSIANNDVRSISEDSNGNLWLVVQGKGVDYFDLSRKVFHHYNHKNNKLSNDYTFQVFNDSKGNLWVTTAWGLNLLKIGDTIFKIFYSVKGDATTLCSNEVTTIYEDDQHQIWVGTAEGLNKLNPDNQTFTRYSKGLKNKEVRAILSDRKNNIWISTRSGISKFDVSKNQFINFDKSDGLLSREFHINSCFKNNKNTLFFGGSDGIDYFNPDSLDTESLPPKVLLSDFKLFYKIISPETDNQIIKKHISYANQIDLDHNKNSFSILYHVINLAHPEDITYSYKLEGFDKDWVLASPEQEANYTNLSPGKYTFLVKARVGNGDWSVKNTSVELNIIPAWWMTIWFKIFVALIIIIALPSYYYSRLKQLNNQKLKLEMLVMERTTEITSKNELLKDLNSTKDKLFSIISHDLRSPFNAILGFIELLLNDYDKLTETRKKEMIRRLEVTTKQVFSLVENLLNWSRIQSSSIKCQPVVFDIKEVALDKLRVYQSIADAKNIELYIQIPDKLNVFADIQLLETILRNLVNNAIKFTESGGSIVVKAIRKDNMVEISVIDSGIGMASEQLDTLFSIEKTQSRSGTHGEKGTGLGLVLCKEFVSKNNGTLAVESKIGKGTTIRFTIPTSKNE